jgi:uncharacterized protein (TIGR02246 family)
MRRLIVLTVLLCALAGSSPAAAQAVPDEKGAVLATFEVLRQAVNTGNVELFMANVTDDVMLLDIASGGAPPVGRAAFHDMVKQFFSGFTLTWDNCVTEDVAVAGDLAFHRYTGILSVKPKQGGDLSRNQRRYLDIFRRKPDGSWRLWQHIFTAHTPSR